MAEKETLTTEQLTLLYMAEVHRLMGEIILTTQAADKQFEVAAGIEARLASSLGKNVLEVWKHSIQ